MAEHESAESQHREQESAARRKGRWQPGFAFERELALEIELNDLQVAAAFLVSYVRDDVVPTSFFEITHEIWLDQVNRLNWLARRIEAHVAEANRIFAGEDGQPPATGAEGQP